MADSTDFDEPWPHYMATQMALGNWWPERHLFHTEAMWDAYYHIADSIRREQ
jgi:hypothetical protein